MTTTAQENRELVRESVERFNRRDYTVFDERFADDVVDHMPFGESQGAEAAREGLEKLHSAFPDLEITLDEVIAEGDTVAMRATHRGTHEGPFMGIEPTGTEFETEWIMFVRIEDGKAVERWMQGDVLGLMDQLGAVDPPTT